MSKKNLYYAIVAIIALGLLSDYIPGCHPFASLITAPVVLFMGLVFALVVGQPQPKFNKLMSKKLLQWSVVGLGFGMNVEKSLQSGSEGMTFTIISVVGTMLIGMLIGYKLLHVDRETSYLVSSGTAICGGSAIAAVGPVIKAKDESMSVALATIFILNAIALFIFPPIGHALGMDNQQFGTWAAIAIHDTSSVVGAGSAYSEEALEIATTIKLTRALWIVPLALATSYLWRKKDGGTSKKLPVPMFIIWFIVVIVFNTYVLSNADCCGSWGADLGKAINGIARKALVLTMFFIGASLSRNVLRQVGIRPLLQGVLLWIAISCGSLAFIML